MEININDNQDQQKYKNDLFLLIDNKFTQRVIFLKFALKSFLIHAVYYCSDLILCDYTNFIRHNVQ